MALSHFVLYCSFMLIVEFTSDKLTLQHQGKILQEPFNSWLDAAVSKVPRRPAVLPPPHTHPRPHLYPHPQPLTHTSHPLPSPSLSNIHPHSFALALTPPLPHTLLRR